MKNLLLATALFSGLSTLASAMETSPKSIRDDIMSKCFRDAQNQDGKDESISFFHECVTRKSSYLKDLEEDDDYSPFPQYHHNSISKNYDVYYEKTQELCRQQASEQPTLDEQYKTFDKCFADKGFSEHLGTNKKNHLALREAAEKAADQENTSILSSSETDINAQE